MRLESLYMTKSLTNKIYLKTKLFWFKMQEDKSLEENLDEFNKVVIDLENIGEKIDDENQAVILLNSLPPAYNQLRDTIRYSRDSLSIEELESAIRSKELEIRAKKKTGVSGSNNEALNVRGRTEKRNNNQKYRGKSRSKSKKPDQSKMRCHYGKNLGHFRRECPK